MCVVYWDLVSPWRPLSDINRYRSLVGCCLNLIPYKRVLCQSLIHEYIITTPYDLPRMSLSLDGVNPDQVSDSFAICVFFPGETMFEL